MSDDDGRGRPDDLFDDAERGDEDELDDELDEGEGPGDDEEEDDDDDDDEDLTEAAAPGPDAPWAPVPTWLARTYRQQNPDAAVDFIFPEVYEEDRSALLKDVLTAEEAQFITHRRAAEQAAKELGVESYDYNQEQANIRAERKAGIGPPQLGAGDALGAALGAPPAGPPEERRRDEPEEPKRADLAAPTVRAFRRDMRTAEEVAVDERQYREIQSELRALREALARPVPAASEERAALIRLTEAVARVVDRLGGQPAGPTINLPAVNVHPTFEVQPQPAPTIAPTIEVHAPPVPEVNVRVEPPEVTVNIEPPAPRAVRFERDKTGAIIRSVPEEPQ